MIAFPWSFLPWTTPSAVARAIWLVSFALLVLMLVLNRALRGAMIIAGGLACNLVAVVANHGLMPVLPQALRTAGDHYHVHNNSIQVVQPHLGFLVDRWGAPQWLPLANVFSVGDVLIAVGTIVAIAAAMRAQAAADDAEDHGEESANGGGLNRPTQVVSSPRALPVGHELSDDQRHAAVGDHAVGAARDDEQPAVREHRAPAAQVRRGILRVVGAGQQQHRDV